MRLGMGRKHSIWRIILPMLCLFFIVGIHYVLKRAEPIFYAECSNYSNTVFTDFVNKCVIDEIEMGRFDSFFKNVTGKDGGIAAVEAETDEINRVKSELLIKIQNKLNGDYPAYVRVHIGSLMNYSLLAYCGPTLKIRIYPISIVNCELEEAFESVGINNIRHKLYLKFTVDMQYRGYMMNERERIETTVPLAETVIAGAIPEYYGDLYRNMQGRTIDDKCNQ